MKTRKTTIAHMVRNYLFTTGSWIYGQLINLQRCQIIILTSKTENLNIFPIDPIYEYQEFTNRIGIIGAGIRKSLEYLTSRKTNYFTKICLEHDVDLLHAHFGWEGYSSLALKRRLDIPLITTFYGADVSKLPQASKWIWRYKQLFQEGDLFLAEGSHMAQCVVDLGCPPNKVKMIHLGVDLNSIKFVPRKIGEDDEIRLLMVSSFREKKGIPYAIKAFIQAEKSNPNLRLTIIGGATTPKNRHLFDVCNDLVRSEQLSEKVKFLGYLQYPEYIAEQQKSHIFIAPSITATDGDTEGGAPVSIIEASAAGMPVLSTFHCDIPEVVINNVSGLLVPERDVSALTSAILELADSTNLWLKMGTAGRKHIEESYAVVKQVEKLEMIYSGLL